MLEGSYQLGLSDLLDQNLSCYEFFLFLSKELQKQIERRDIGSFEEMQEYVARRKERAGKEESSGAELSESERPAQPQ